MSAILERYMPRTEFSSYKDFYDNYVINAPEDFNFGFDVVDAWADIEPDKLALWWIDDSGGEYKYSFSDMKKLSGKAANFFSGLGIGKGDFVALLLKQRYEYWICAVALHKIGAVVIPASVQLTAKDIEYRNNAAGVKAIVALASDANLMKEIGKALDGSPTVRYVICVGGAEGPGSSLRAAEGPGSSLRAVEGPGSSLRAAEGPGSSLRAAEDPSSSLRAVDDPGSSLRTAEDPSSSLRAAEGPGSSLRAVEDGAAIHCSYIAFGGAVEKYPETFARPAGEAATRINDRFLVYFTSGTTGMPKMVMHDCAYPLGHITTAKYWQRACDGALHMTVADSGWAKFGWGKIYGQWICGAAVFALDYERFAPVRMLEVLQNYPITTFCAPPTMYRFMLQENVRAYDLSTIKHYSTAGEPLNPEVFNQWKSVTGRSIYEGFGQSESSVLLANFEWFEPKPGSMGKPSPLYNIVILDEDGRPCDEGIEGQIVVGGTDDYMPPGLIKYYHGDEAVNGKAFRGGNYNTGDIAWMDPDGYYWFVGRNDDIIKSSGYRIGPFEVESALIQHDAVVECAVTSAPDPIRGQVVKATVVLARGYTASEALAKELQNHVKRVTAPYKYPRIIDFTDELPKTIGGIKIKRGDIRARDNARK